MRRLLRIALVVSLLVATRAAAAETVVRFDDGRWLRVDSHHMADGWVRFEVAPHGSLATPVERVEFIQRDGRVIYRRAEPGQAPASVPAAAARPNAVRALRADLPPLVLAQSR